MHAVKGLYDKKNVSDSAMDQATADLASAQAALDAATARLEQAQEQLEYTEIRAPYSGIVTHRHVQVGEMASPGQPVMSGISLDELRVIVDVPQSVIPAVRGGGSARIYLPDGRSLRRGRSPSSPSPIWSPTPSRCGWTCRRARPARSSLGCSSRPAS